MHIKYRIEHQDKLDKVIFSGPINENLGNNLAKLESEVGKVVTFVLKDIDYINSIGIRCWLEFLRNFEDGRTLVYEDCAPDMISQINMIPHLAGNATITTFFGTLACPSCETERLHRFAATDGHDSLIKQAQSETCPKCKGRLELEEDADAFFSFLST